MRDRGDECGLGVFVFGERNLMVVKLASHEVDDLVPA